MATMVDNTAPAPGPKDDFEARLTPPTCNACMAQLPMDKLIFAHCQHKYCPGCLKTFFTRAMKDESLFPPTCCSTRITLRIASGCLPKGLVRKYKFKSVEMKTKRKTYCHRVRCSAFIAPQSIHNGNAFCQRCGAITCVNCKSAWHWGQCIEADETGVFELAKMTQWKRCPECERMIEKIDGCNHVTCRCGTEFCYGCGLELEFCGCNSDDDDDEDEMQCGNGLFD